MDADSWRQSIEKQVLIATRLARETTADRALVVSKLKYFQVPNIWRYFQIFPDISKLKTSIDRNKIGKRDNNYSCTCNLQKS